MCVLLTESDLCGKAGSGGGKKQSVEERVVWARGSSLSFGAQGHTTPAFKLETVVIPTRSSRIWLMLFMGAPGCSPRLQNSALDCTAPFSYSSLSGVVPSLRPDCYDATTTITCMYTRACESVSEKGEKRWVLVSPRAPTPLPRLVAVPLVLHGPRLAHPLVPFKRGTPGKPQPCTGI